MERQFDEVDTIEIEIEEEEAQKYFGGGIGSVEEGQVDRPDMEKAF